MTADHDDHPRHIVAKIDNRVIIMHREARPRAAYPIYTPCLEATTINTAVTTARALNTIIDEPDEGE